MYSSFFTLRLTHSTLNKDDLMLYEMLILLFIGLGIGCAMTATARQPSVALSGRVFTSATGSWERLPGAAANGKNTPITMLLSMLGRLVPQFGRLKLKGEGERMVATGVALTERQWLGLRVCCALGAALLYAVIAKDWHAVTPVGLVVAVAVGWILPMLWLRARLRRRKHAIITRLPEVIDLLSLCIGAGMDFLGALNKVMAIQAFKQEPIVEELAVVLQEIKLGKRRFEALKAMAKRVDRPEMSSFVRTLVQADRMGTPIAEVLSVHSEDIRFDRFTRAERAALRAPIKILAPLIFCIMPCVAIIVGGPILLQFLNQNPFGK